MTGTRTVPARLPHDVAFGWGSLNPIHWLGGAVSAVATDGVEGLMMSLFSAAMWLLGFAFKIIDLFVTPDVSTHGPIGPVYQTTFWVGIVLTGILFFAQVGMLAFRHDGKTFADTVIGIGQFGAVWIGYITTAELIILAAAGLEKAILDSMLHVSLWSDWNAGGSVPRSVVDATTATVLGLCGFFLIIPSAFAYVFLMLAREAGLVLLTATSPIAAAGLLFEKTRTWFWKMLRWFFAAVMMAPAIALVVGTGVKLSQGVTSGAGHTGTTQAVGESVIAAMLLFVGALSPIVLFKLLAFVDPNTASGSAMRSGLAANGGLSGFFSGSESSQSSGSGAAAQTASDGSGRSAGEASADATTTSRLAAAMSAAGGAVGGAGGAAAGAAIADKVSSAAGAISGAASAAKDALGGSALMAGGKAIAELADKAAAHAESALGGAGVGHGGQGEGIRDSGPQRGQTSGPTSTDTDQATTTTPPPAPSDGSGANHENVAAAALPAGDTTGPPGKDGNDGNDGAPGPAGPGGPMGQGAPAGIGSTAPAASPGGPGGSSSNGPDVLQSRLPWE